MQIYNTASRQLEEVKPLQDRRIGLYTCGPTVYDYQHIGNYATYIRWDILYRTLSLLGYDVKWYMNITDVGHLVSDDDEGEDKLEKGARREGKSAWEIAKFYTRDFIEALDKLNISINKTNLLKATDHIKEQINLIRLLEKKGFTYVIDDGVYFDSSKFPDYGQLARLNLKGQIEGARVAINKQKRNPTDFALWKFSPKNKKRDMEWQSPWGMGFPGWHIECSAMAMKYLGETIDMHAGGVDHIPIHHTNEIAQSEAATGKQFVRCWVHANHMLVDNQKMAKSLNNFVTIHNLEKKGHRLEAFRVMILQGHYRSQMNFTLESLEAAEARLSTYEEMADQLWQASINGAKVNWSGYRGRLTLALEDDLNTPNALAALSEIASTVLEHGIRPDGKNDMKEFLTFVDSVLGLNLSKTQDITDEQKGMILKREQSRGRQDWEEADRLRSLLQEKGIDLRDTPNGTVWHRSGSIS